LTTAPPGLSEQTLISQPESRAKAPARGPRLGTLDLLLLSAWCGLVGGELEVAAHVGSRAFSPINQLYLMTRHFAWLIPLIDLALFLAIGAPLAMAARRWPRRAGWWAPRLIIVLALLPALGLAGRKIYMEAWLMVALGIAIHLAPMLERHPASARRRMALSLPILLALVLLQAGWVFLAGPMLRARGQVGRPMPPAGSPNVLLIVVDTVRASDHPGGCNFLFADRSVHFLKSSIALSTYWSLGTKSNGEVISSDSY